MNWFVKLRLEVERGGSPTMVTRDFDADTGEQGKRRCEMEIRKFYPQTYLVETQGLPNSWIVTDGEQPIGYFSVWEQK